MKSRFKRFSVFAVMIFTFACIGAEQAEQLILKPEDARLLVLSNDAGVLSSEWDVKAAEGRVKSAEAAAYPHISRETHASWIANPTEAIVIETGEIASTPTPIPPQPLTIVDAQDPFYYSAALSLDMPVYTRGKLATQVEMREHELKKSRTGGVYSQVDAVARLFKNLYALMYHREALSLVQDQRELTARMLTALEGSMNAGAMTDLDYQEAVLNARKLDRTLASLSARIRSLEREIVTQTGMEDSIAVTVSTDGLSPEPKLAVKDGETWVRKALTENPSLKEASYSRDALNSMAKLAEKQSSPLPDMFLNITGGWNGSRLPFDSGWEDKGGWFMTVTIGSGGTLLDFGDRAGNVQEAQALAAKADEAYRAARENLVDAIYGLMDTLATLEGDVRYADALVDVNTRKMNDEFSKRDAGASSDLSTLKTQSEQLDSILDLVSLRMQYTDTAIDLLSLAAPYNVLNAEPFFSAS
jgi:outer membrane protein TolC